MYFFSEQEILREEIKSLNAVKSRLKLRITELEDEVKKVKEEFEKNAKANKSDDEVRFLLYLAQISEHIFNHFVTDIDFFFLLYLYIYKWFFYNYFISGEVVYI